MGKDSNWYEHNIKDVQIEKPGTADLLGPSPVISNKVSKNTSSTKAKGNVKIHNRVRSVISDGHV